MARHKLYELGSSVDFEIDLASVYNNHVFECLEKPHALDIIVFPEISPDNTDVELEEVDEVKVKQFMKRNIDSDNPFSLAPPSQQRIFTRNSDKVVNDISKKIKCFQLKTGLDMKNYLPILDRLCHV
jgi:hypothetical protein